MLTGQYPEFYHPLTFSLCGAVCRFPWISPPTPTRLRGLTLLAGKEGRNGVPRVPAPASSDPRCFYSTYHHLHHCFNQSLPRIRRGWCHDTNAMCRRGSLKSKLWLMRPDNIDEWKRRRCDGISNIQSCHWKLPCYVSSFERILFDI